MRTMIVARYGFTCILVWLLSNHALAKGGSFRTEDRYNPQHIEGLPSELRKAVMHKCSTPKALHEFAQYSEHLGRITLHYEHFYCGERDSFCNASGCLHEVYISSGGHYRLLRSYYAPN